MNNGHRLAASRIRGCKHLLSATRCQGMAVLGFLLASLTFTLPGAQTNSLISMGAVWKYLDDGSDQGTAWTGLTFNDTTWNSGPGQLGYGDGDEATVVSYGPDPNNKYTTTYFRRLFTVSNPGIFSNLSMTLIYDDGAVVYINGVEVYRINMPTGAVSSSTFALAAGEYTPDVSSLPASVLAPGTNIVAVEMHQANLTSSDISFDMELDAATDMDITPPTAGYDPAPNSALLELTLINVIFSEAVTGVDASDLLINGAPAASVVTNNPNDYTFHFPEPPTGVVQVAWSPAHGITDLSPLANPFAGGSWSYRLNTNVAPLAPIIISEFMANNHTGIRDEDGNYSDWIELWNAGTVQTVLDGWFLTDDPMNLTKWQFPAGLAPLQPNNYLLVWASGKNRTNPAAPLHTNFRLAREAGNYLALVDPQTNVASAFASYPLQYGDVSYGRDPVDPSIVGYYLTPTPRARNSTSGPGFVSEPIFSVDSGIYTNDTLRVTISLSNAPPGSTIRYTLNAPTPAPPTNTSTLYTGPITLNANAVIKARVYPPAGTNLFPSPVVAKNYIFLDSSDGDFNSNLPLLIISTQGQGIPDSVPPGGTRLEGTLAVIDTYRGRSSLRGTPEFIGMAGFEYYGQTSIGFPKRPVRFEIHDELGNSLDVSLLGLPADADWKTRNPYDDKTLLNDYLGYELFEKMGHYSCRRRFVEVFIDTGGGRLHYPDDYTGVEVLFETIKAGKNRVDIKSLTPYDTNEPAITGGYIFKKDKDSAGDINFNTAGGYGFSAQALKIHEPKPNELRTTPVYTAPLSAWGNSVMSYLTGFLNQMERALYAANWTNLSVIGTTNHYSYYLDADAFVDQFWIVEFTKQIDGYRLSDYFTKDRLGKVAPYPIWDWNLSFGNANYLQGGLTNGWYYDQLGDADHIWARRLITGSATSTGTAGDPDFCQKISDRWSVLRTNILNGTNLLQEIDQLSTMLSEAAARDLWGKWRGGVVGVYVWPNPDGPPSWNVDYVHPTNYLGNATNSIIGQMKGWVLGRYLWIDGLFTPVPTFNYAGGRITNGFTLVMSTATGRTNWYTLDGTDPRSVGGGISPAARRYTGPVTINSNVLVFARARGTTGWQQTWSGPSLLELYTTLPPLRITEIMYHPSPPPPGDTNAADNFEFIEVKNTGATPLNLNHFSLSGGVTFQFPDLVLQPGQCAVVVRNLAAFQARYGTGILVAGVYTGGLNNAGDHVVLLGPLGEPIHDFNYSDNWYPITDGTGFSLVITNAAAPLMAWNQPGGWRVSSVLGGSPGVDDPAPPPRPAVVVNEALTHSDTNLTPGLMDAIELYNSTANSADISGWFLTDKFNTPKKFRIPDGTIVPAGCFLVIPESSYNPNPGVAPSFGLSATGDNVYLFSADLEGNLTGYAHGFSFGAQANGVTFGRYVISTGQDHFVTQREPTLGTNNAGPLVGPVVISEIMYHPLDIVVGGVAYNNPEDEYLELRNLSSGPVLLYDQNYPTNTWRLRNAVDFDFPTNTAIPASGLILVVSFDPAADPAATAAFRARNYVADGVPLYGPWIGGLNNAGEAVDLERPDLPDTNGVPYILVERVEYSDQAPWPGGADGLGLSLQRIVPGDYGNDPTNWVAVAPTPGSAFVPGATVPTIVSQPGDQLLVSGRDASLSVTATGTAPLRYQWRWNGLSLPGATNSTLTFSPLEVTNAGVYNVLVYNAGGSALGTNFTLSVRVGLRILTQPHDTYIAAGGTTNFSVQAEGTGPLRYQWAFNSVNIALATNRTYSITNVQTTNVGVFTVQIWDSIDSLVSRPANLVVMYRPTLVQQPLSQTLAVGDTAAFSVISTGTPPIGFRWRRNNTTILPGMVPNGSAASIPTSSVYTITGVQLTNAGTFSVVASNVAHGAILSSNAYLAVVVPPTNQTVQLGGAATLRAIAAGPTNATYCFFWLFNGLVIQSGTNTATQFTNDLTFANITLNQLGNYTFLLSNAIVITNTTPWITNVIGLPAAFTAALQLSGSDSDGDGLPDWWEILYGLNPRDPSDAGQDADGDGMTNLQEYLAGTDPRDPASVLKIVGVQLAGAGQIRFDFVAVSNKTYRVDCLGTMGTAAWSNLSSYGAALTNRTITVTDQVPPGTGQRVYRVRTP